MEVLREVAILRRLSHPNVIQLQGAYRREKTELVVRTSLYAAHSASPLISIHTIPSVTSAHPCDPTPCPQIITEFCDGGSLADLCARAQRAVPEPILKILMRDLLRGLAYLHEVNIIHRFDRP